jgi:hypothetical protein
MSNAEAQMSSEAAMTNDEEMSSKFNANAAEISIREARARASPIRKRDRSHPTAEQAGFGGRRGEIRLVPMEKQQEVCRSAEPPDLSLPGQPRSS